MLLYMLAPCHIAYKLGNCNKTIHIIKIKQEYEKKEETKNEKLFAKLVNKYVVSMQDNDAKDNINANECICIMQDINHNKQFTVANQIRCSEKN